MPISGIEKLIRERQYVQIAHALTTNALSPDDFEATLDDSCFAAIESSRYGASALAELASAPTAKSPATEQLFGILGPTLADDLAGARRAALAVHIGSLNTSLLLAVRLALSNGDIERARNCARMLGDRHPKGDRAHPDLAALSSWQRSRSNVVPRHRLAICSSLKDEAEYLEEWVRYHASIGVEHFYLYNNASADGTQALIDRLGREFPITQHYVAEQPGQKIAFGHFLEHHAGEVEWACMIDGDEFINLETATSVLDVLSSFGDASAVACSWMNFGSGGHVQTPPGPCVEAFTKRAAQRNAHVKSIVRPNHVIRMMSPHQFLLSGEVVDGSGKPVVVIQGKINPPVADDIRINHYITKSKEQWDRKKKRGRPLPPDSPIKMRTDSYFAENDRNEVEDTSIWRLSKRVQAGRR